MPLSAAAKKSCVAFTSWFSGLSPCLPPVSVLAFRLPSVAPLAPSRGCTSSFVGASRSFLTCAPRWLACVVGRVVRLPSFSGLTNCCLFGQKCTSWSNGAVLRFRFAHLINLVAPLCPSTLPPLRWRLRLICGGLGLPPSPYTPTPALKKKHTTTWWCAFFEAYTQT